MGGSVVPLWLRHHQKAICSRSVCVWWLPRKNLVKVEDLPLSIPASKSLHISRKTRDQPKNGVFSFPFFFVSSWSLPIFPVVFGFSSFIFDQRRGVPHLMVVGKHVLPIFGLILV